MTIVHGRKKGDTSKRGHCAQIRGFSRETQEKGNGRRANVYELAKRRKGKRGLSLCLSKKQKGKLIRTK